MSLKMLTVKEVAEAISVSEWAVRKWVREGKVPGARKFGNSIRIPESFLLGGTAEENAEADRRAEAGLPPALDYDPRDEWEPVEPKETPEAVELAEPPAADDNDDDNDEEN